MKNNLRSKKIISIVLITLLLLFTTKAYAQADSFSTTIQASYLKAKRGDSITITIGLKDISIESGEKGIGAYTASIKFDSSVLEYDSSNGTKKWEAPFYQNGLIAGNTKDGEVVNTTQEIGTITFKVKEDATLGETTITLANFSGSTAESDVSATNKSIKITIEDNQEDNGNNDNPGDNNNPDNTNKPGGNNDDNTNKPGGSTKPGNNNNNTIDNSSNNNEDNNSNNQVDNNNNANEIDNPNEEPDLSNEIETVDTSVKQDVLPKTGTIDIIIFVIIGICILLAIILFIRMKIVNRKMK